MATRQTLKDFLKNQQSSTEDRISYNVNAHGDNAARGDDLGDDTGTGKQLLDLDNATNGLLGDYLNYITELANNNFKILAGNAEASPNNRGDSLANAESQGAENVFIKQGTTLAQSLSMYSDSGNFQTSEISLEDIIDKTGNSGNADNLLKNIPGHPMDKSGQTNYQQSPVTEDLVIKASQDMLRKRNRFSNTFRENSFANQDNNQKTFEKGEDKSGILSSQEEFGDYQRNLNAVTLDQLKSMGASLIYKAAGFDIGDTPEDSASVGELEMMIRMGSADANTYDTSGYVQRDASLLRARNAKGFPSNPSGYSTRAGSGEFLPGDPDAMNSKSFGSTYGPAMPFKKNSGKMAKIKATVAIVALMQATSIARDLLKSLFDKNRAASPIDAQGLLRITREPRYDGPGPHGYGRYRPLLSEKLDFLLKNVLTITDYPYSDCVEVGTQVFFGKSPENKDKIEKTDFVQQAHGFWLAVASSVLKTATSALTAITIANETADLTDFTSESLVSTLSDALDTKFIRFLNVAATVGDLFLKRTGGRKSLSAIKSTISPWNVDALPDGPGTRVSKSRSADGLSQLSLSWAQNSTPSLYMLPRNVVRAVTSLNQLSVGTNPLAGMLGSDLINNTYLDKNLDGSYNRIPSDVVKNLEDRLDAEYVPFYLHDLRTNEILSFHAFLTSLRDQYNTQWNSSAGYGRMDPVQTFQSTGRTVNVGFTLIATSKEDFNTMWYKINKLTTLFYPQWTQGTQVKGDFNNFIQPFSQVMGASPIVRMRVGDVIKSNYSKFNLSRIFGIGDQDTIITDPSGIRAAVAGAASEKIGLVAKVKDFVAKKAGRELITGLFYAVYGSPLQYINGASGVVKKTARNLLSNFLPNGSVNPLASRLIMSQLISPDQAKDVSAPSGVSLQGMMKTLGNKLKDVAGKNDALKKGLEAIESNGYGRFQRHLLKATSKGYMNISTGEIFLLDRPVYVMIMGKSKYVDRPSVSVSTVKPFVTSPTFQGQERIDFSSNRTVYEVKIVDPAAPYAVFFKDFYVYHEDIAPNPSALFNAFVMPTFLSVTQGAQVIAKVAREAAIAAGIGTDAVDHKNNKTFKANESRFMLAHNNPVVRAFDTTKGRGLAGALEGLSFDWLVDKFPWEIDHNSRAPIGVDISFSLKVIHDIPPGLDHSGYNRAPLYNVGDIMKTVAGDPHDDDGMTSEFTYKNAGRGSFRSSKDTRGD